MAYAIKAKKDGAWVAIDHPETPVIDGARQEPIAVRKKIDGVWVDFWTNAWGYADDYKLTGASAGDFMYVQDDNTLQLVHTISAAYQYFAFAINFKEALDNPLISFDYEVSGGQWSTYPYYATDQIEFRMRKDSNMSTSTAPMVLSDELIATSSSVSGTASLTWAGTGFTVLYVEIVGGCLSSAVGQSVAVTISNLTVNGEKVKFTEYTS